MPSLSRPSLNKARLVAYVPTEVKKALQHEAVERRMTISDIVEEALRTRMRVIHHPAPPERPDEEA